MSLNNTPSGERLHIALFGRRNAGKSSVINAVTSQKLAIVSEMKGTTTDPVYKAMELLPIGPVMLIDTPGLDDSGTIGAKRIEKAKQVLNKTDIAILVIDGTQGIREFEMELMEQMEKRGIPFLLAVNKIDLQDNDTKVMDVSDVCFHNNNVEKTHFMKKYGEHIFYISAKDGTGIDELKEAIAKYAPREDDRRIVGDLIQEGDLVVLVVPIDKAAPKGRLILPQQQTIRDILDSEASAIVVKETKLKETFESFSKTPKMVITDSQVFEQVEKDIPNDIPLTSFSILFARYKGELNSLISGVNAVTHLKDGDRILMSEGCTHHRQCDDIGTVKIPNWLKNYTKKDIIFEHCSGSEFPEDLSKYSLIVHCGGCMLNPKEMKYRIKKAEEQGIPITNYGMLIAMLKGILKRSLSVFPDSADI